MTLRKLSLWFIFIGFTGYSTWLMLQIGYFGIWQAGIASAGSIQILLDLVIACFLIISWMKKDAESRGVNPYPWIALTVSSGTIGILLYLIVREYSKTPKQSIASNPA